MKFVKYIMKLIKKCLQKNFFYFYKFCEIYYDFLKYFNCYSAAVLQHYKCCSTAALRWKMENGKWVYCSVVTAQKVGKVAVFKISFPKLVDIFPLTYLTDWLKRNVIFLLVCLSVGAFVH